MGPEAETFQRDFFASSFVRAEARRGELENLAKFYDEALPRARDIAWVNAQLSQQRRQDLAIQERAEMDPHSNFEDFDGPNNYTTNNFRFRMQISVFTERKPNRNDQKIHDPKRGIAEDELLGLIDRSFDLGKADLLANFAVRPVFIRLLACFPEFTTKLVTAISGPEKGPDVFEPYAPELFVAYQLMAQLVDESDPEVLNMNLIGEEYVNARGVRMTYLTN